MNELCSRIADILRFESREITFQAKNDQLIVDLDCYALSGTAAGRISDFTRKEGRTYVISIREIENPKIQLLISL